MLRLPLSVVNGTLSGSGSSGALQQSLRAGPRTRSLRLRAAHHRRRLRGGPVSRSRTSIMMPHWQLGIRPEAGSFKFKFAYAMAAQCQRPRCHSGAPVCTPGSAARPHLSLGRDPAGQVTGRLSDWPVGRSRRHWPLRHSQLALPAASAYHRHATWLQLKPNSSPIAQFHTD